MTRLPLIRIALILALLPGCFELSVYGTLRSTGSFVGTAGAEVPSRISHDPSIGPLVVGDQPTVLDTWQAQGVLVFEHDEKQQLSRVFAADIDQLNTPWMVHKYRADGGDFRYAVAISFPARAIATTEERLQSVFGPLAKLKHGGNPAAYTAAALGRSKVEVQLKMPGTVSETDGERLPDGVVRWRWDLNDLRSGQALIGYANGSVSWWRRVLDPILDLFARV